jgi:glycosyltransferase involved in cell wall biosynthesis
MGMDTEKSNLISVIIPCYNLDTYLEKCLDSILVQTYKNLEVITVDDGSTDKTHEILSDYTVSDSRIVHIKQENAGAGEAINRGIERAGGEFITFVDNDDRIEPTMYEKLHNALVTTDADMAVCNFNLVYDDHTDFCYSNMKDETVSIYDDVYGYFCRYCACPKPNNYIWSRLYKMNIVKGSDVRFENFRLGADSLFNFKLLPLLKRVTFINDGLYNYVQRSDSSVYTAAKIGNIAKTYADGFESLADYFMEKGFNEFKSVLPIHAFTRLRSVFFYSRLAGMDDTAIVENLLDAFKGHKIADYLTGAV